ncbi:Retrovirus-related Pol polyprotein from transposon TNT 1-94 [Araneus ventricosus]|uniref:Retrovirus-related Pol polyprotein from transposon TNT 1-94 n=1 Tax=Araneus ventricosus TaxID=182803 RepID=A0A4Y2AJG1_ARAVE|nr:Retrovirus-related Pol polyprotein from transposon TNT 1-94 [Araneus ventricosus]
MVFVPETPLRVPARYELNAADIVTPQTYEEALNSPQADTWKEAIKEEINSLEKNETWNLVPVPETSNVIRPTWVFKIKYLPNGEIERYKTRLCTKGFCQVKGVDFSETFSPPFRRNNHSLQGSHWISEVLAITTHPDIAFAVNVVSRFTSNPGQVHWNAVKRIFRYLKGTAAYGIEYSLVIDSACHLAGYSDVDFANDVDTRKSTSGYVFKLRNGLVTWCSQKQ